MPAYTAPPPTSAVEVVDLGDPTVVGMEFATDTTPPLSLIVTDYGTDGEIYATLAAAAAADYWATGNGSELYLDGGPGFGSAFLQGQSDDGSATSLGLNSSPGVAELATDDGAGKQSSLRVEPELVQVVLAGTALFPLRLRPYGAFSPRLVVEGTGAGDPAAPPGSADATLFTRQVLGKTQLCVQFATGAAIVLATEL